MRDGPPVFWPVVELIGAYRRGELSPVEVTSEALERIQALNPRLHAYLTVTADLALRQAGEAEALYRAGASTGPLLGVPVSIKDLFDVEGVPTSLGSLVYRSELALRDSGVVARLREAGAVVLGKTNTAEFGQSATTENLIGPPAANPWALGRTPGGSSGGGAVSVAAGMATVALGSDGGGSIRIPAAMCGLFGFKPTIGQVTDEGSFRGMTHFVCPGPLARRVGDARPFMAAITGSDFARQATNSLRIGWCPAPDGRPVEPAVAAAAREAVERAAASGHRIEQIELPIDDWRDAFGPLVLADEWRYRGHLLDADPTLLTPYARRTIEVAADLTEAQVEAARGVLREFRTRVDRLFDDYDLIVTPTTATVAFPIGDRPDEIAGATVDKLWGPFPFTAPFNVAGSPAASLPCGLAGELPVGLQVVGRCGCDRTVLDFCEQLESALEFPAQRMIERWSSTAEPADHAASVTSSVGDAGVAVVRFSQPEKRNAMTLAMLDELALRLQEAEQSGAPAVVLTGGPVVFSSGIDLAEVGGGVDDLVVDEKVDVLTRTIRSLRIPVIAAIEGPCVGAALDIALACDERVAGASSSFSLPAARLGLLYRPAAVQAMVRELGRLTAARLLVLGERLTADEALAAGIAGRVVPPGAALHTAVAIAQGSQTAAPRATTATKQLIRAAAEDTVDLAEWEAPRRELLEAPERRRALAAATRGRMEKK